MTSLVALFFICGAQSLYAGEISPSYIENNEKPPVSRIERSDSGRNYGSKISEGNREKYLKKQFRKHGEPTFYSSSTHDNGMEKTKVENFEFKHPNGRLKKFVNIQTPEK